MQTSYFSCPGLRAIPKTRLVSIAHISPLAWKGRKYPQLAPYLTLLAAYKRGDFDWAEYTRRYYAEVLDNLDPRKVVEDVIDLGGEDAILLCYEKAGANCHRRLAAEWLYWKLAIYVPEWGAE